MRQHLSEQGIPSLRQPDGAIIRLLTGHGSLTVSNVGAILGITKQGASKTVASMQQRGLVRRSITPGGDWREHRVELSQLGHDVRQLAMGIANEVEQSLIRDLGHDQVHALRAALARIAAG